MSEQSQWKLVEKLKSKMPDMDDYAMSKARNLISWYDDHGYLTGKQQSFGRILLARDRERRQPKKQCEYFLYAISDKVAVKLGYSTDPKKRLKSMQTGHPTKLELLWTLKAGDSEAKARKEERKLHRYCRKHRKRGEWFSLSCMKLVDSFEVRSAQHKLRVKINVETKRQMMEAQEQELAYQARQYI